MREDDWVRERTRQRTVVHISGEAVEQTQIEGREVPPNYPFVPGIKREYLRKRCRTFLTLADSVRVGLIDSPSFFRLTMTKH
jgi:hypothetical protein